MQTIKKSALLAPILGSIISTVIWFSYSIISIGFNDKYTEVTQWINLLLNAIKIIPLLFIIFLLFLYVCEYSIGLLLYKCKVKYKISQLIFYFYSFMISIIIGLVLGYVLFKNNDVKYILTVFSIGLSGVFTSSLFIVLSEPLEKRKGLW